MGILGSFSRYIRSHGRLLYTEALGLSGRKGRRQRKGRGRAAYVEFMEPRLLMTTLYGGEAFQYIDSVNNTINTTLNGNVIAELVGAVQVGGTRNVGGYLVFGDIVGRITSGPRLGMVIGNGSMPVTLGTQGSAEIAIPGLNYTSNQVNLQALASNLAGQTFTFNAYNTDDSGNVVETNNTPNQAIWTFQILELDTATGTPTEVYTTLSTDPLPIIPLDAEDVTIPAAAYNPINGEIIFYVGYTLTTTTGTVSNTTYTTELFSFNSGTNTVTDINSLTLSPGTGGAPRFDVTAMTIVVNASDPSTATLHIFEEPNGNPPPFNPAAGPQVVTFAIDSVGDIGTGSNLTSRRIFEGYGSGRNALEGVTGATTLPGDATGIYVTVGAGANSHVVRLDLNGTGNSAINGTPWGDTTDLLERTGTPDGQNLAGLTYNPAVIDPFTGTLGAWLSMDVGNNTHDLIFINHKLRISKGDVFTVYSNIADMTSSIVFQGGTLYTGNTGALGSNASTENGATNAAPAATGLAYLGYRGQLEDNSTNETFIASAPFLSGALTSSLGILPGLVRDTTDLSLPSVPTNKLFAGLTVGASLQQTFNPNNTAGFASQLIGSNLNNLSGLAIAPDGTIAVVNSGAVTVAAGDQLAFVDQSTGAATGTILNVVTSTNVPLRNVQGLAYGQINLNSTAGSLLYAVYDRNDGNGPTLGTLTANASTAIWTPLGSGLGLGAHGKVKALAFTPGGTPGDPTHQSIYIAADPNALDSNPNEILYQVGTASFAVTVAPIYNSIGGVTSNGGIGTLIQGTANALSVASLFFDTSNRLIALDRKTGRLEDVNLTTGAAGVFFLTDAGVINPTVAGVALDPATLHYVVADNVTGFAGQNSTTSLTSSSILMTLKDFTAQNSAATSLGKFLFDGTVTGKVTVLGSMELFYAGWLITGDATVNRGRHGTWRVAPSFGDGTGTDSYTKENYFKDNFYIGGDIRNIIVLSSIGTNGADLTTGTEIHVLGRLGAVNAKGTISAVIHASNQDFVPSAVDQHPLIFQGTYDSYQFTFKGSAEGTTGLINLTNGGINQAGSVFANTVQPIDNFTASFDFTATSSLIGLDGGLAFVLQNQGIPVIGSSGTGLGYKGILNSAAIIFSFDPTTGGSSIGFATNSNFLTTTAISNIDISSGDTINVTMTYNGASLLVSLADLTTGTSFTATFAVNLAGLLNSHGAYIGFTGSTGTQGSSTTVSNFVYGGGTPGQVAFAQKEIQKYLVNTDYTFASGYLVNNGGNAPFANNSFDSAQFLGSIRSAVAGRPDLIHVEATLDGAQPGNGQGGINNTVDWYAFGMLAGQTVNVTVLPRTDLLLTGATPGPVHFAVYDPDGNQVYSDFNWFNSVTTQSRTIQFKADRPGAYRVAIDNNNSRTFAEGQNPGNTSYDLLIEGPGLGNMGIGAVVAGAGINLVGSSWVASSTLSTDTITNPSIWSENGDVGVVQAGGNIIASNVTVGLSATQSASTGFVYTGSSSSNIFLPHGNLRVLQGANIGIISGNPLSLSGSPDINVNGDIGLIRTTGNSVLSAFFSNAASGNIQVISSAADIEGVFRTNKSIGVIRAATVSNIYTTTEFHVDADRNNNDGFIDLIDVSGDWGGVINNSRAAGASIISGPGGNVRFMRVGGALVQDSIFRNTILTGDNGEIVHIAGPVTYTDDSGAVITLTPSSFIGDNGSGGTMSLAGQITTRVYGVRGAGGVVILDVTSTTGLTVNADTAGVGQSTEVGTINIQGTSSNLSIVNGVPTLSATNGTAVNLTLMASNGGIVNAFSITGTSIDNIVNQTAGDLYIIDMEDVGTISSNGNIGTVANTTGAALIPVTSPFANTFPFSALQYSGVNVANAALIKANKAIGNIRASGVIGTITPNADGVNDPNVFEGLVGLIAIDGTATGPTSSTNTAGSPISVTRVNLGEGMATMGSGTNARTGIFAIGQISNVVGTEADIRGNIISQDSIGTISLTNGSIINSKIAVFTDWTWGSPTFSGPVTLPSQPGSSYDTPVYGIHSINVQGNGGIMTSIIEAADINNIVVGPDGYGFLIGQVIGTGTLNNLTVGGLGARYLTLNFGKINNVSATGSGAQTQIANYSSRVRTSEQNRINPYDYTTPNIYTDLPYFLLGDGIIWLPDVYGLTTGVIGQVVAYGEVSLGNVSAYDARDSSFTFPVSTGAITIRHDVDDVQFITGSVKSISVARNATNFEVSAAGSIGAVSIGGNFAVGTNTAVTSLAQISAKGSNGNITSFVNKGTFAGLLLADGKIGSVTIGTAGTKTTLSTGDFSGTISIGGNHLTVPVLNNLKIYGSIFGGVIDVTGNVGTIDVAHDLAGLAGSAVHIRGNLTNLILGSDPATSSAFGAPIFITGNLASGLVTGQLNSQITVQGNVSKFAINSDTASIGLDLMSTASSFTVGGTLSSMTVQGGIAGNVVAGYINTITSGRLLGNIWGGRGIASAAVSGGIFAGASVNSGLGDIKKLSVTGGDINGIVSAPNGAVAALTFSGNLGATGAITAATLGAVTIPGGVSGTLSATISFTSLKAGSITSTAYIASPNLGSVTTTGNLNGVLNIGKTAASVKLAAGTNFGAIATVGSPLAVTVGGGITLGAQILSTSNLTSLAVKGAISGAQILVDGTIGAVSGASMANSIFTAGFGFTSLSVTGTVNNTLVSVGLSRGNDGVFGNNDIGEQARMADLGTVNIGGAMFNTIIAAGGNINAVTIKSNMSSSTISSGLVLGGPEIAAVLADATPLASAGEIAAALDETVLHGNIKSISVGAAGTSATLINSSVTAGVSPGLDGTFGTSDDNVNTSVTGGVSAILSFKGVLDGSSNRLANSPGGSATLIGYTVGTASSSILPANPITGAPTATATPGSVATISTAQGIITITVTGLGARVQAFDDGATTDRLDTILISNTANSAVTVVVTTSSANSYAVGRVITADGTNLSSFTFNGDILGDGTTDPDIWIDSDMSAFSARNLPNDGAWTGQIGGNVAKLTLNQLGPGRLRVGGRVTTLTINSSVGDPTLQQLGSPGVSVTQMAYDPSTGNLYAFDGANLLGVVASTGAITSTAPIQSINGLIPVSLSGLTFDASGNLLGVADVNNFNPVKLLGSITTTGDNLRGLAIKADGTIYAIDTIAGVDNLVTFNPTTGAETVLGPVKDPSNNTYSHNILALAFDGVGNLLALTNDRDGSGLVNSTSSGVALGRITIAGNGLVRLSNPTSNGLAPVLITGNPTNDFTGLAVDPTLGTIYTIRRVGATDELDTLAIGGTGGGATVTRSTVGLVKLGSVDTNLTGIGVDESHNIIGLNIAGSASELVGINATAPTSSVLIDAPGILPQAFAGFAITKSGTNFTSYAYTTDGSSGGQLFSSLGVTSTIGFVSTTGSFTQLLPATQDASGTVLSGNIISIAADASGHVFAITDDGILVGYNQSDGSLIGAAPIGAVRTQAGANLQITRIAFDGIGRLVGLSAGGDNLVAIATTSTLSDGVNVALAANLTDLGTVEVSDLTSLTFSASDGQFLSFSQLSGNFVSILGTSPDELGGIVANSFGAVTLPAAFTSRIAATGAPTGNAIDSIKLAGTTGTFTGKIHSATSIGTFAATGITFAGSLISHGDLVGYTQTGAFANGGIVAVDGTLKSFTLTGPFNGTLLAGRATTITINGSIGASGVISVLNDIGTLSVSSHDAGEIIAGTVKTLKITGTVKDGASLQSTGDVSALTLTGGMEGGSTFVVGGGAASVTVGSTLAGTLAFRRSVGTATILNMNGGLLDVGQDISTLNLNGTISSSLVSSGTWIGDDGIYNTADDVILGGNIGTAKVASLFRDSMLAAGILPREGTSAGANNIPTGFLAFDYNANGLTTADIDSTESGGIGKSVIGNVTFSKPVVSTNPVLGLFAAVAAADGITKVTGTGDLHQIVRNDPPGAPAVATTVDPITGLTGYDVVRVNSGQIEITFDQPINSATINASTISIIDTSNNTPITDLTFGYYTQTAGDGTVQGVVQIFSASNFGSASGVTINLHGGVSAPTIADRTGLRSSLLDYNQDGVRDPGGDPFGTTIDDLTLFLGPPTNDVFAKATVISGFPAQVVGSNINATVEAGEPVQPGNAGGASVWWSWTAPADGAVTISTDGSDFNTLLAVYTGDSVTGLLGVAYNDDDNSGSTSTVTFNAVAGTVYRIVVDGSTLVNGTAATGNIVLSLAPAASLANDNFANATVLPSQFVTGIFGNNVLATAEASEPPHDSNAATSSVWFSWTAPTTEDVLINTVGSDFDVVFAVYTGTDVTLLTLVGGSNASQVYFSAIQGETYMIAIDGFLGDVGNFVLNILPAVPPNDNFANATILVGIPVVDLSSNFFATKEANEPNHANNVGGHSVWWSWTAPASGLVQVDTIGSTFDTTLAVYTGTSLTTLTLVGFDDQSGGGLGTSLLSFNAVGGTTYLIAVDGWSSSVGTITLHIV